jgi:hypothetical protein
MKHTIVGRTGRAQLVVCDLTGENVPLRRRRERPDFCVRLLPRSAHRSTSFSAAGDQVYCGPDLQMALLHIKAWTGLEEIRLPREMQRYIERAQ